MVFSALIVLSNASIAAAVQPVPWMAARTLYGFAINGMFIVGQSWLNDVVANRVRGRVMAIFYVAYVVGLGTGAFLLRFIDLMTPMGPLIGIVFTALSILPVGMTRLRAAAAAGSRVGGVAPCLGDCAGRHGRHAGVGRHVDDDRRLHPDPCRRQRLQPGRGCHAAVCHAARHADLPDPAGLGSPTAPTAATCWRSRRSWSSPRACSRSASTAARCAILVLIYVVWSGASDSIYSLASAHANDRASKDDLVALASTMLFAWSLSGFVVPGIGTLLTAFFGTKAFMYVAIVIAVAVLPFVMWRMFRVTPGAGTGDRQLRADDGPGAAAGRSRLPRRGQ